MRFDRSVPKLSFRAAGILLLLAASCAEAPETSPPTSRLPERTEDVAPEALRTIRSWVERTRGWPEDAYSVGDHGVEDEEHVYLVVHENDLAPRPGIQVGGSEWSFEVRLDRRTGEVTRELHFQ